jgi:hypothetical protein
MPADAGTRAQKKPDFSERWSGLSVHPRDFNLEHTYEAGGLALPRLF